MLAEAAESVATPQIRNVGTLAGNVCQRPWCWYFRNGFPCFKDGGNHVLLVRRREPVPRDLRRRAELHRPSVGHRAGARRARRHVPHRRARPASGRVRPPSSSCCRRQNARARTCWRTTRCWRRSDCRRRAPGRAARITRCWTAKRGRTPSSAPRSCSRWTSDVCRSARVVLGGVAPIPWRLPEVEKMLAGQRDHGGAGREGRRDGGRRRAAAGEERATRCR